jgi:hypothetical protein
MLQSIEGKVVRCLQAEKSMDPLEMFQQLLVRFAGAVAGEPILLSELTEGDEYVRPSTARIRDVLQTSELVLTKLSVSNFFALRLCEVRHLFHIPCAILVQSGSPYFLRYPATPFFQANADLCSASTQDIISQCTRDVVANLETFLKPGEVYSAIDHYLEHASCFRWGQNENARHAPPHRYTLDQYRSGVDQRELQRQSHEYQAAKKEGRQMTIVSDRDFHTSLTHNKLAEDLRRLVEYLQSSDVDGKSESICLLAAAATAADRNDDASAMAHLASISGTVRDLFGDKINAIGWVRKCAREIDAHAVVSAIGMAKSSPAYLASEPFVVLFLGANPSDQTQLALTKEVQEIDDHLQSTDARNRFRIEQQWEVQARQLAGKIMRFKPTILHFSGHGTVDSALVFVDDHGDAQTADGETLSIIFRVLSDTVRCVILNACYSERQAEQICQYIDAVIGMSDAIGDVDAIVFSSAFYEAIGYGKCVADAFELAKAAITLSGRKGGHIPRLFVKAGVAPDRLFFN